MCATQPRHSPAAACPGRTDGRTEPSSPPLAAPAPRRAGEFAKCQRGFKFGSPRCAPPSPRGAAGRARGAPRSARPPGPGPTPGPPAGYAAATEKKRERSPRLPAAGSRIRPAYISHCISPWFPGPSLVSPPGWTSAAASPRRQRCPQSISPSPPPPASTGSARGIFSQRGAARRSPAHTRPSISPSRSAPAAGGAGRRGGGRLAELPSLRTGLHGRLARSSPALAIVSPARRRDPGPGEGGEGDGGGAGGKDEEVSEKEREKEAKLRAGLTINAGEIMHSSRFPFRATWLWLLSGCGETSPESDTLHLKGSSPPFLSLPQKL